MSTAAAIRAVAPALPPGLVAPAALEPLTAAGALLPLTTGGGFECHLGRPERVDLAVRFLREEGGPAALRRAPWPGIAALAGDWHGVSTLWLEFDLDGGAAPTPSVFFGNGNREPMDLQTGLAWIARLRGTAPRPGIRSGLLRAWPAGGGWVGYIGLMLGRADAGIRLTAYGLQPSHVAGYLGAAGWPGDAAAAAAEVAALTRTLPVRLVLHLDIGVTVGPAFGVELSPPPAAGPREWRELLLRVLQRGDRPPGLAEELLAWPGVSRTETGQSYVRRLNHVKLVYRGAAPPAVKGYLYYGLLDESLARA